MGYKGKNDKKKVRIELTAKIIVLPTEEYKTVSGRKPMQ